MIFPPIHFLFSDPPPTAFVVLRTCREKQGGMCAADSDTGKERGGERRPSNPDQSGQEVR